MTRHTAGVSSNGEAAVKQHDGEGGGAIICLISINGVKKREKKKGGKVRAFLLICAQFIHVNIKWLIKWVLLKNEA